MENPDHLLAGEFARLSFDLAFLAFSSDFLFAVCNLFTISDSWYVRNTRGSCERAGGVCSRDWCWVF